MKLYFFYIINDKYIDSLSVQVLKRVEMSYTAYRLKG